MRRYEVRENSRWNANIKGFWVILDVFTGCVVVDGFMSRRNAVEICAAFEAAE